MILENLNPAVASTEFSWLGFVIFIVIVLYFVVDFIIDIRSIDKQYKIYEREWEIKELSKKKGCKIIEKPAILKKFGGPAF